MYKFAIIASLAASLALPVAHAGQDAVALVSISSLSNGFTASGAIAAARLTGDTVQYIGCGTLSYEVGSSIIQCYAVDAAGKGAYCQTSNPAQAALAAVSSINESSDLYFAGDSSGHCTYLSVSDYSDYFFPYFP
jgi:hypothetical protein